MCPSHSHLKIQLTSIYGNVQINETNTLIRILALVYDRRKFVVQLLLKCLCELYSSFQGAFEHFHNMHTEKFMVCAAHRLQCKTLHFPKHKFQANAHGMFQHT